jgi:hypothetical protein
MATPIRDWHKKLEAIQALLGFGHKNQVYTWAVNQAGAGGRESDRAESFEGAAKKWESNAPSDMYKDELTQLSVLVFNDARAEALTFFKESSIDEFNERRAALKVANDGLAEDDRPDWELSDHHTLLALDQERILSVRESMKSRRLDQRLYYMNIDSAQAWQELINSGDYQLYNWCSESLGVMMHSNTWKAALASGDIESVVMLGGGGAATKDIKILSALVDAEYRKGEAEKTRYVILDISPHMISSSILKIKKYFQREPAAGKLFNVESFVADMLGVAGFKRHLRRRQSRNLWFITGGTIGNINEGRLVEVLNQMALPEDLLAVGIDTYDAENLTTQKDAILKKYKPTAILEFLATPLSILLHQIHVGGRRSNRIPTKPLGQSISVDLVDGRQAGYSDIDGSMTVEVKLVLEEQQRANGPPQDDDSYTLLTSTRYDLEAFQHWFLIRGWRTIGVFAPPESHATFRQVLLQRASAR